MEIGLSVVYGAGFSVATSAPKALIHNTTESAINIPAAT